MRVAGIVVSLPDIEIPADCLRAFTHIAIETGADIIACHGSYLLRGVEFYHGRPILDRIRHLSEPFGVVLDTDAGHVSLPAYEKTVS